MDTLLAVTSDPVSRYLSQRGAKFDRKNRMRTMNSSEILDMALRIYQRLGITFLRLTVTPALLCLASIGFIQNFVLPNFFLTNAKDAASRQILDIAFAMATGVFVGGPLFLIGLSYSSSIVVSLVSDYITGKDSDLTRATILARTVLPRLFLVNLKELCLSVSGIVLSTTWMAFGGYLASETPDTDAMAGVVTATGVLGFIAGGVVFLIIIARDALAAPVAVLEDAGARQASKRSRQLLKRQGYHPAGTGTVWLLYTLLVFMAFITATSLILFSSLLNLDDHLASLLSFIPAEPVFLKAFDLVPSFLVIWTLLPVWATVITIVYYERKIRLEGYDIDVLASDIAGSNRALIPEH